MKLTLHIDDNHAPLLIQLLGTLLAKSSPVEGNEDPAPGHPELPLQDTDEADLRWGVAGELDEEEPARVDDPVEPKLADLVRPETGKIYRTRHGVMIKIGEFGGGTFDGHIDGSPSHRMFYTPDGHTVIDDGINADPWDLVQAF